MHKRLQDITACGQKDREETEQQNGRTEQFEPRFLPRPPPPPPPPPRFLGFAIQTTNL